MIKCASIYTYEIDRPDVALDEINKYISRKITLQKNTVGLIMCHPEFIATGVLKHICDNLPFDVAGITTASQAVNDEAGELILTVFIMTSDDVSFKTGVTDSLDDDVYLHAKNAYDKASAGEEELPGLVIFFTPFNVNLYSGDEYVRAWGKLLPSVPIFGTVATDDTASFEENRVIYNGVCSENAMPFILFYGAVNPRFLIATLPEDTVLSLRGKVTKTKGNIIYEINDINTHKFFADAGIPDKMATVPLMMSSPDDSEYDDVSVIRELFAYSEDNAGILGGDVDEGSTISVLSFKPENIKSTLKNRIEKLNKLPDVNGVIIFSCVSRRKALLAVIEDLAELELAKGTIKPEIPFMMGYSGGEFCPVMSKDGTTRNRFHNYSAGILII